MLGWGSRARLALPALQCGGEPRSRRDAATPRRRPLRRIVAARRPALPRPADIGQGGTGPGQAGRCMRVVLGPRPFSRLAPRAASRLPRSGRDATAGEAAFILSFIFQGRRGETRWG